MSHSTYHLPAVYVKRIQILLPASRLELMHYPLHRFTEDVPMKARLRAERVPVVGHVHDDQDFVR